MSEVLSEKSRISETDVNKVFEAVYNNDKFGLDEFLTFLFENLEEIIEKCRSNLKLSNLIMELASKAIKKQQLSKVSLSNVR